MPTYEYTCKKCGESFDIVQSFTDKPLKKHPGDCGGPVQKVFHASGIVFEDRQHLDEHQERHERLTPFRRRRRRDSFASCSG